MYFVVVVGDENRPGSVYSRHRTVSAAFAAAHKRGARNARGGGPPVGVINDQDEWMDESGLTLREAALTECAGVTP